MDRFFPVSTIDRPCKSLKCGTYFINKNYFTNELIVPLIIEFYLFLAIEVYNDTVISTTRHRNHTNYLAYFGRNHYFRVLIIPLRAANLILSKYKITDRKQFWKRSDTFAEINNINLGATNRRRFNLSWYIIQELLIIIYFFCA